MKLRTARRCLIAVGLLAMAAPAWAGSQIEKTLKLDPGGKFVLEADEGSVDVVGTDQAGASVVVTSYRNDLEKEVDLKFEEDAGIVRVREQRRYWNPSISCSTPWGFTTRFACPNRRRSKSGPAAGDPR